MKCIHHPGAVAAAAMLAMLTGAAPSCARAQSGGTESESTVLSLGEVVVHAPAGPLSAQNVFSSVNIVPGQRLEDQMVTNNWQLFSLVPGVMLTQFGQGTTSGKLSMRAFNGEGEINAVKLLIDGVPSNSNDGNMPYIDLVPPIEIEALEVVKGTNDPRYGLHNIAGNASIITLRGGNYQRARLTAGSFGTVQAQAALGIERDGLTQNYAVSRQVSSGHRDHALADGTTFSGKWFAQLKPGTQIGLIVRHHQANAQEPGYLTAVQAHTDPTQSPSHNATDEDRRRMSQVALQAESALSDALHATAQVYMNDLYDLRYVRFSAAVSQQERLVDETHVGASTQLTWRLGQTAIGRVTLAGGLDTERQNNHSDRYNTVNQVRIAQTRNQQFDFNTAGGFVQAVISPTDRLTVIPAVRADVLWGTYTNQLTGVTYDMNNYGVIRQPKLSAIYKLNDHASVYGNWGRTFQVGVGTASYKVGNVTDLDPSLNDGWELGIRFNGPARTQGRVAWWQQVASNEARRKLNDPANDSENIGRTLRKGLDIELNGHASSRMDWWLSTSLQTSQILKADAASLATEGKEIDHVPYLLYGAGVDYRPDERWRLSAWATGQSNYYLERTNTTGEFGAYALLNVSAAYQLSSSASVDVQIRNLTDRYYEYVWYDGTQTLHASGPGRGIYLSLTLRM